MYKMPPKLNITEEEKRLRRNEQSRLAKQKKAAEAKAKEPVVVAEEGDLEAFAPKKRGGARVKAATAGLTEAEKKARRNEQSRLSKQKRKAEISDKKFAEEYRNILPSAKALYEEQQAKAKAKEASKKVPLTEKLKRQQEIIAKYPPLPKADLSTLSEAEKKARRNEQSRLSKAKQAELKALEELKDYDFDALLDMDSPSSQATPPPSTPPEVRKKEKARVAKATQRAKAKAEAPKMKEARVATPPQSNTVQDTLQSITKRIAEIKATPATNSRHSELQAEAIERELEKLDALMRPAQAEQSSARVMPFKPQSLQPA